MLPNSPENEEGRDKKGWLEKTSGLWRCFTKQVQHQVCSLEREVRAFCWLNCKAWGQGRHLLCCQHIAVRVTFRGDTAGKIVSQKYEKVCGGGRKQYIRRILHWTSNSPCSPSALQIDTLAAEYPAVTNYLYVTYSGQVGVFGNSPLLLSSLISSHCTAVSLEIL